MTDYQAYYAINPFGLYRSDLQAALITSMLANIHRGKGRRAYDISDFVLTDMFAKQERRDKWQEKLLAWCQSASKKGRRKD